MSTGSSKLAALSAASLALCLTITVVVAGIVTPRLLNSHTLRERLRAVELSYPEPRCYWMNRAVYHTLTLEAGSRERTRTEIYISGASNIGAAVNIPQLKDELKSVIPVDKLELRNLELPAATVADTLDWYRTVPKGHPDILVLGVFYRSLQPRDRGPQISQVFPLNNARVLGTIYVSAHTSDQQIADFPDPEGVIPQVSRVWKADSRADLTETLRELPHDDPFPNAESDALHELARLCRERGTRLVVVRTPINPLFMQYYIARKQYPAYAATLENITQDGAVAWNMETCLPQPEMFYDLFHTSPQGRDEFTKQLAGQLEPLLASPMHGESGAKP